MMSIRRELLSRHSRYADPAGRFTATFGAPWRRAAASGADWAFCWVAFLVMAIPLGAIQSVAAASWEDGDLGGLPGHIGVIVTQVLTAAPAIAYFALLLPTSQTYGMRLLGVRVVSTRTGRAPSYPVALVRSVVATAVAVAFYLTYLVATTFDKPRQLDAASSHAILAAHVVAVVGAVSALVMIVTPTHRSVLDRLFGSAVLDELEAVTPRMGPWGPLDSFDLSRHGAQGEPARSRSEPA
jgi:uncharacterized RDD family membrane protein YckC